MRRTASFRRDFSTAVDDYNTFQKEKCHMQEAFAEPALWPSQVTGTTHLETEPTQWRSQLRSRAEIATESTVITGLPPNNAGNIACRIPNP